MVAKTFLEINLTLLINLFTSCFNILYNICIDLYLMKIKEQTRNLPQALLEYGKVKPTWFEEIFEEY